jgi:hypothetical protein
VKKYLKYLWFLAVFLAAGVYLVVNLFTKNINETDASNTTKSVLAKVDWDAGTLENINSPESGDIEILDKGIDDELLYRVGQNYPAQVSVSENDNLKLNIVDKNESTGWYVDSFEPGTKAGITESWWKIDLGEVVSDIKMFRIYAPYSTVTSQLQVSDDDSNWTTIEDVVGQTDEWLELPQATPVTTRYIRFYCYYDPALEYHDIQILNDLEIWADAIATHTSAASQITNTNLYQWQTFTSTYTAPANTTVSFRLRTSTDANTWTSWTSYQTPTSGQELDISSLVASSTGDAGSETFYKYIQVETKLTSSDGTSTPTVDDYSIGYHTNVVPDKPVGATVTMGN